MVIRVKEMEANRRLNDDKAFIRSKRVSFLGSSGVAIDLFGLHIPLLRS